MGALSLYETCQHIVKARREGNFEAVSRHLDALALLMDKSVMPAYAHTEPFPGKFE